MHIATRRVISSSLAVAVLVACQGSAPVSSETLTADAKSDQQSVVVQAAAYARAHCPAFQGLARSDAPAELTSLTQYKGRTEVHYYQFVLGPRVFFAVKHPVNVGLLVWTMHIFMPLLDGTTNLETGDGTSAPHYAKLFLLDLETSGNVSTYSGTADACFRKEHGGECKVDGEIGCTWSSELGLCRQAFDRRVECTKYSTESNCKRAPEVCRWYREFSDAGFNTTPAHCGA
jgi:hypothetical protein